MKKLLLLLVLPIAVAAQPFPPATTTFTRGFLKTTDQTSAQSYLGVTPGGSSSPTNTPIILSLGGTGGTNVSGGDWSQGSGSGTTFKLILTANAYLGPTSFSNVPTTNGQQNALLYIIQDGTGTHTVTWTNSVFGFVNGVAPVQTTNAGAVDVYSLMNSLSTNGNIWVVPMNNLHR